MLGTFKLFGSSRDPPSAGPQRSRDDARALAQGEPAGPVRAPSPLPPSPRREGEERRSDRATGAGCACAANSCHPVRNKYSKFPKSPWAGGHRFPSHLPPRGRVLAPARAPGKPLFRSPGDGAGGGRGPGGLPGTVPLRAGQQWVPASGRAETPGRRRSVRGRRGCHSGERVAGHGRRAGKWEPVTARSGPRGGSVPGLAVLPGTGVGVALGGAEERAVVRECRLLTFPLPARSAADSGEAGPGAPLGAISSLGLSRPAT